MEFVTKKTNKKKRKEGSKPGNSGKDGFWTNVGEVLPGTSTSVGLPEANLATGSRKTSVC